MSTIRVINGSYRNKPVVNQTFTLVKGFTTGKKGSYVTVKNEGNFDVDIDEVKIKVDSMDELEFAERPADCDDTEVTASKSKQVPETDEQAMDRIQSRFNVLDEMSLACIRGEIRAMIVSGPPGVGKSFGVEQQMERETMFDRAAGNNPRYHFIKGAMTALGLYAQLYKYSDSKNVLIFDDCDSVFADDLSLNILKAALDSGKHRKICWNSDSSLLRREGIPDCFEFHGSAIFITNLKFANVRSKKLQDHLEALQSRCHYIDLTIDSPRDKLLRIKQVHRDCNLTGGLFSTYDFAGDEGNQVIEYMEQNQNILNELSMRMALKLADLVKISPSNWRNLARATCCKR